VGLPETKLPCALALRATGAQELSCRNQPVRQELCTGSASLSRLVSRALNRLSLRALSPRVCAFASKFKPRDTPLTHSSGNRISVADSS
jgi:hypothetical protein